MFLSFSLVALSVLFQISTIFLPLSCLSECFLLCVDKGDRRQRVKWLPAKKFEQVRLALLLLTSSHYYKTLLTKENLQGVCRHLDRFTHVSLPHLQISSCNFYHKDHKVYKHLHGVMGGEEAQASKAIVASSWKMPAPARMRGRKEGVGKIRVSFPQINKYYYSYE